MVSMVCLNISQVTGMPAVDAGTATDVHAVNALSCSRDIVIWPRCFRDIAST